MYLITVLKGKSDNVEIESDFLISFLSFDNALIIALTVLPAFSIWKTETVIIQKLECLKHSALNNFIFLTEAFFWSAFIIFNNYYIIQILIDNIIQSNIE